MSPKEVFEVIALAINLAIGLAGLVVVVGLIVIIAFPELLQPRGYYRNKLRVALRPVMAWLHRQCKFVYDVIDTLSDRQKLRDTLDEIETGQRSLQLR